MISVIGVSRICFDQLAEAQPPIVAGNTLVQPHFDAAALQTCRNHLGQHAILEDAAGKSDRAIRVSLANANCNLRDCGCEQRVYSTCPRLDRFIVVEQAGKQRRPVDPQQSALFRV